MIWFFLAGWIAGAVGMLMVLNWWAKEHIVSIEEVTEEETDKERGEEGNE